MKAFRFLQQITGRDSWIIIGFPFVKHHIILQIGNN